MGDSYVISDNHNKQVFSRAPDVSATRKSKTRVPCCYKLGVRVVPFHVTADIGGLLTTLPQTTRRSVLFYILLSAFKASSYIHTVRRMKPDSGGTGYKMENNRWIMWVEHLQIDALYIF